VAHIVDVYPKYSLGARAVLKDRDKMWSTVADPDVLASYESSIRQDLMKAGIAVEKLHEAGEYQ
jgi:hypothetical protein